MTAPKFKQLRRSYGFDEVAIVPGETTVNPDETNIELKIGDFTLALPVMAAAMDAITDVTYAVKMGKLGGLAVLNLEGIQARYDKPQEILAQIAQAKESPGLGYEWGMSQPHAALPRGTRIKVGTTGTLEQILFGPTSVTNGSQNLIGALRTAMGVCGAATIKEMQQAEMVIAPAITTEGKAWQLAQH